jgi:hypothetical protein
MQPDMTDLNIGSIGNGATLALFEKSLAEVARNIADTDTEAEASRSITITFKFKPESDRRTIHISTSAKTTLAGCRDNASKAFIAKDEEGGIHVVDQDPRQDILFPAPAKDTNLLKFNTEA